MITPPNVKFHLPLHIENMRVQFPGAKGADNRIGKGIVQLPSKKICGNVTESFSFDDDDDPSLVRHHNHPLIQHYGSHPIQLSSGCVAFYRGLQWAMGTSISSLRKMSI